MHAYGLDSTFYSHSALLQEEHTRTGLGLDEDGVRARRCAFVTRVGLGSLVSGLPFMASRLSRQVISIPLALWRIQRRMARPRPKVKDMVRARLKGGA